MCIIIIKLKFTLFNDRFKLDSYKLSCVEAMIAKMHILKFFMKNFLLILSPYDF